MSLNNSDSKISAEAPEPGHDTATSVDANASPAQDSCGREAPADGEVSEAGGGEAPTREDLEYQLADLEGQIELLRDQLLRRQAELINYRKRVERERAGLHVVAQGSVLEKLLPVIDDFERAVVADTEDVQAYRQGVELILRSMENVLTSLSVERMEPLGETFDPEVHEAMARMETEDVPEGEVVEVYQPGYRIRDRLLRPARVIVAMRPTGDSGQDDREAGESSEQDG